jgi:hypothetical protein
LLVDFNGDLETKNSNYYVGDFAKGRMDVYEVQVKGQPNENIEGTVTFTYDDTFGESTTVEKAFKIENYVSKNAVDPYVTGEGGSNVIVDQGNMDAAAPAGFALFGISPMFIGIIVVAGIVIILFIRKKRRNEQ